MGGVLRVMGIDLSGSKAGWVRLDYMPSLDFVTMITDTWGFIKPKMPSPVTEVAQLERLAKMRDELYEVIPKYGMPELIVIEDYAPAASPGSDAVIGGAEMGGVIKLALHERGFRLGDRMLLLHPSRLKKFVCGTGGAKKDLIRKNVFERWGFNVDKANDDVYDAYGLAMFGLTVLAHQAGVDIALPPFKVVRPQLEVIEAATGMPMVPKKARA